MSYELLPLIILGLFSAATLLWFVIGASGKWFIKAAVIVLFCLVSVNVWSSIYKFSGWPTQDELPEKFRLHWAVITEPKSDNEGGIKLWITSKHIETPILLSTVDKTQPRAYSIPYTRENHQAVSQGVQMVKNGQIVEMSMTGKQGKGGGGNGKPGNGKATGSGKRGTSGNYGGPESKGGLLYILPPSASPNKDNL